MRKSLKSLWLLFFILLFIGGFFYFKNLCLAEEKHLIITEIMFNPEGSDNDREWLEIYNPTDKKISVEKKMLGLIDEKEERDETGKLKNTCHTFGSDLEIKPKEFIIIGDKKDPFEKDYPDFSGTFLDSTLSLANTEDTIKISFDRCETWETEIKYSSDWGGKDNSIEKIKLEGKDEKNNWQESYEKGGTPGKENSEKPDPKVYSDKIRINEILPNATEEYIELYNFNEEKIDLSNWILKDSSKTGKYVFSAKTEIKPAEFLTIYKKDYKFSLNNSGDESVYLYDPNEKEVSKVSYFGAKKDISYNFDGKNWRWSRFLTPNKQNKLNSLPKIKIKKPDKIYSKIYADFSVSAKDADKDSLKFTWDFGDEHKSYKKETSHKYAKKGTYNASLKIFDGSEEKIEKFKVEVKSYPKYDVDFIEISPNPKGQDSEFEYILIKNDSKKKINLEDWKIATGWNKLYNHPVNKKFSIDPGQTEKLTRIFSNFSLNNKKSKIELRYPNGKTADKVSYEKNNGVKEDEIYRKTDLGWQWIIPISSMKSVSNNSVKENTYLEIANLEYQTEIPEEFIGKFSSTNNQHVTKSFFTLKNSNESFSQNTWPNKGFVLGLSTIKNNKQTTNIHSSKNSLNKYFYKINLYLNNFISYFLN